MSSHYSSVEIPQTHFGKMLNRSLAKKKELTATRHQPIRCYEFKKLFVWQMSVEQKIKIFYT